MSELKLTNRQKEFSREYVEGIYSNAECARKLILWSHLRHNSS